MLRALPKFWFLWRAHTSIAAFQSQDAVAVLQQRSMDQSGHFIFARRLRSNADASDAVSLRPLQTKGFK
jgi:hypothetical protein